MKSGVTHKEISFCPSVSSGIKRISNVFLIYDVKLKKGTLFPSNGYNGKINDFVIWFCFGFFPPRLLSLLAGMKIYFLLVLVVMISALYVL